MYERSAIVLERYIQKIFGFDKENNLKDNYKSFKELLDEVEKYQELSEKEGKIIKEFDDTVREIETIQAKQEKICKENQKLEQSRNQLFMDLGEDSKILDNKFKKIEKELDENHTYLKELREDFVGYLNDFSNRQKERNKCEKAKRIGEANHIEYVKKIKNQYQSINSKNVAIAKEFIEAEKDSIKQELNEVMTKNGKNEKVGFNQDVLKIAIKARISITEKEAECYTFIYDKMKKILTDIENDNIKLDKYKKYLNDVSSKLEFLEAEKEYIFGFLDYERMTTIAGIKTHTKMMEEACKNFELDMIQIHNLYELLLREISNKSTKKAYRELYNKTYLKNIEDKEKNFEEEVNSIKINMGTVINSNYWRIEGIKNVYNIFQEEVTQKYNKDLSEFKLEENIEKDSNDKKTKNKKEEKSEIEFEEPEEYEDDYEEYDEEDIDDIDEENYEDYDDYDSEEYEEDEEYYEEEYEDYDDEEDYDDYDDDDYEEYDDEDEEQEDTEEVDDDAWEKEIIQQLNKKRTTRTTSKKQNNIFGKLFKDKKDNKKKNDKKL